jgi:hypothetical protein
MDEKPVETLEPTIIPAAPGWYVAQYFSAVEHQNEKIELYPIIAWRVWTGSPKVPGQQARRGYASPITMEGTSRPPYSVIKSPDGRFFEFGSNTPFCHEHQVLEKLRDWYDRANAPQIAARRAAGLRSVK